MTMKHSSCDVIEYYSWIMTSNNDDAIFDCTDDDMYQKNYLPIKEEWIDYPTVHPETVEVLSPNFISRDFLHDIYRVAESIVSLYIRS